MLIHKLPNSAAAPRRFQKPTKQKYISHLQHPRTAGIDRHRQSKTIKSRHRNPRVFAHTNQFHQYEPDHQSMQIQNKTRVISK